MSHLNYIDNIALFSYMLKLFLDFDFLYETFNWLKIEQIILFLSLCTIIEEVIDIWQYINGIIDIGVRFRLINGVIGQIIKFSCERKV